MKQYIRLNITTEGHTEHRFVKDALSKALQPNNIYCEVRSVLTSKELKKRGGMTNYAKAKRDILQWIKNDHSDNARFTTMFDFYALPTDFPGFLDAQKFTSPYEKVSCIENAFADDINDYRFIPYIQLHEFEALLYADLDMLLFEFEGYQNQINQLKQQLAATPCNNNPELVNEKRETSPSHRIIELIPPYQGQKVGSGCIIAELIGIEKIRNKCKHFNDWLTKLENIK